MVCLAIYLDTWLGQKLCALSWSQSIVLILALYIACSNIFTGQRVERFQSKQKGKPATNVPASQFQEKKDQ